MSLIFIKLRQYHLFMFINNNEPQLVSVIMGVHNEKEEHLRLAIDSICNQSYSEIEFIIIDDCSNEICKRILSDYNESYENIRIIHNKENLGLTKSLNVGLRQASGVFIARMDADDYSVPTRIEKQVKFLNDNNDISICGTGVVSFGDASIYMSPFRGFSNDAAQCSLFFSSTLCHPSVMMRKSFLSDYHLEYDERVTRGQDYDMWERCSIHGKLAVMREVLLFYRIHSSQITSANKQDQDAFADQTRLRRLSRLGISPTSSEYKCHLLLSGGKDDAISYSDMKEWVNKLVKANDEKMLVCNTRFTRDLKHRLVLYKMRNDIFIKSFSIPDLVAAISIVCSRLFMKLSLSFEIRKFNTLQSVYK